MDDLYPPAQKRPQLTYLLEIQPTVQLNRRETTCAHRCAGNRLRVGIGGEDSNQLDASW